MEEKRFDYRPNPKVYVIATLLFVASALWLGYVAATNDRGMIINRVIELDESQASFLLWTIAGISGLFSALGILGLFQYFTAKNHTLIIGPESAHIPGTLFRPAQTIVYARVTRVMEQDVAGTQNLILWTPEGKGAISNRMFRNKLEWEEALGIFKKALLEAASRK